MKVTFAIINYNRLYYLKSCAESLMESLSERDDVEFICLDDNSKEEGTEEYLKDLKNKGWKILNHDDYRTSPKEDLETLAVQRKDAGGASPGLIDITSDALNILLNESTGDLFVPLHGDMQFVRKNWLSEYVSLFKERDDVFCAMIDAQRKIRLERSEYDKVKTSCATFAVESNRRVPGAGDCFYNRELLLEMGGWKINESTNAEDLFRAMAEQVYQDKKVYVPWVPVGVAIYTDPRGTMARCRGNKRFGEYWEAKDNLYYDWVGKDELEQRENRPYSIEELATSYKGQWQLPIDTNGNWKKNPINWPHEQAEYEIIY